MSRAVRRYGTPAALASRPGTPSQPPRYSQRELRARRRAGLTISMYGGDWSLAREIAEVVTPLAHRVAASPRPARFKLPVGWVAEAVHGATGVVVGWTAEIEARRRTQHLASEPGKRKYAMTTLVDLAPRPGLPEIDDEALASGSWAAKVTAMADGVDAAFSELLGRSYPPGADELRGQASRSERLVRLLGETIDRAALELERRLDSAERKPGVAPTADPDPRARLESLGVRID